MHKKNNQSSIKGDTIKVSLLAIPQDWKFQGETIASLKEEQIHSRELEPLTGDFKVQ